MTRTFGVGKIVEDVAAREEAARPVPSTGCRAVPGDEAFKAERKEFLHETMSSDEPEVTTVTSKGQITIPSRLREEFGLEKGTKLMVVPTDYGLVLKKLELPSVEEFQRRVEERAEELDISIEEIDRFVHEARKSDT